MTKYVLLICTILYAIGIIVTSGMMEWYYVVLGFFTLLVVFCLLLKNKVGTSISITFFIFFIIGILNTMWSCNDGYKLKEFTNKKQVITGRVIDLVSTKPYTKFTIQISTIDYRQVNGKLSVIIENLNKKYTYGDEISFIGSISIPQPPEFEGEADYRASYLSRGIHGSTFITGDTVEYLGNSVSPVDINALGFNVRENIKSIIYKILPSDQAGLIIAIMFGDKSGVSEQLIADSQNAGISHTMATSGLHVSIMLLAFTFLISKISKNYQISSLIGIFILILLFFVIGYTPSISRAILMSLLTLSACFFNRRAEEFTTLGFSAIIILIFHPFALFDVGFILSFASVLGIITIGKKAQQKYKMLSKKIISSIVVTLSALIGTSIFTAYFFGKVTLFGALSNLIIIPIVGWCLPMGYLAGLLGWIYLPVGHFLSYSLYVLLLGFEKVASWGAMLPIASINIEKPNLGIVILYFSLSYLLFSMITIGGKENA